MSFPQHEFSKYIDNQFSYSNDVSDMGFGTNQTLDRFEDAVSLTKMKEKVRSSISGLNVQFYGTHQWLLLLSLLWFEKFASSVTQQ